MICWDTCTYGWVYGQWVGSGQMTNLIKLELINIIWFCLKIYNLSRHPYLWVDGWVNGWAHVKPLKSNKSWPNQDNSIMDILDILLDILLKPPQPFIGLFLVSGTQVASRCSYTCHDILHKICCLFCSNTILNNVFYHKNHFFPVQWFPALFYLSVSRQGSQLPIHGLFTH